jgi:hypothetical protein
VWPADDDEEGSRRRADLLYVTLGPGKSDGLLFRFVEVKFRGERRTATASLPTMAKECRKFGLALVLASQEVRDFHPSLFSAVANYLALRTVEVDARALARNVAPSDQEKRVADRIKQLKKFEALFFREGQNRPTQVQLLP